MIEFIIYLSSNIKNNIYDNNEKKKILIKKTMIFFLIKKWWNRNGWTYMFCFSLLILLGLWLFYSRHQESGSSAANFKDVVRTFTQGMINNNTPTPEEGMMRGRNYINTTTNRSTTTTTSRNKTASTINNMSKGEKTCKEFLEFTLKKKFERVRPSFLKNPVTGSCLELDLYNPELRLAIEYNGCQHYHYNPMMHGSSQDRFQNQKYRDLMKREMCKKNGITLIIVPYTVEIEKIPEFLYDQLHDNGFI